MICTFGDVTDVVVVARAVAAGAGDHPAQWQRCVPSRGARAGWESANAERRPSRLRSAGQSLGGQGPARIVELLRESGDLSAIRGRSRMRSSSTRRATGRWRSSRAGSGSSRRWTSVRRCSRAARELQWHPAYMQARLENWINGLNTDWCISRQRFFGVPFPVWYPLAGRRPRDYDQPISPPDDRLPIDPSTDVPDGYRAEQRGQPGGFSRRSRRHGHLGDVVAHAADRRAAGRTIRTCSRRVFPMDLRPQAHDIIRTWLFYDGAAVASRARFAAVERTRRSPAGSSIPTARRCRSRRATS